MSGIGRALQNAYVNLTGPTQTAAPGAPLPWDQQMLDVKRQQALADALREQANADIPIQSYKGVQAAIPWTAVLAKALQGGAAAYKESKANTAMTDAAAANKAHADALVKELSDPMAHVGTGDIAPMNTQVSGATPALPGQPTPTGPQPSAPLAIPGQQGTGATQGPPTTDQQLAMLARAAAEGGPSMNAVTSLYSPVVSSRIAAEQQANAPLSRAAREQATLQSDLSLSNDRVRNTFAPTPVQQAQIDQARKNAQEDARHHLQEEKAAQNPFGVGVPTGSQLMGKEYLAQIAAANPGLANQIKAIGTYRAAPPQNRGSPKGIAFMSMVSQAYPDYDAAKFANRNAAVKAYGMGGKQGQQMLATSNAISHLGVLRQVSEAMENGNVQALNSLRNTWRQQFGSELPTDQRLVADIASKELIKAIVPGGGGVGEREDAGKMFADKASKGQISGAVKYAQALLAGQLKNSKQRYVHDTGNDDFEEMVSPDAVEVMKHGEAGAGGASAKPPPARPAGVPANWTLKQDDKGLYAYVSPDGKQFKEVH